MADKTLEEILAQVDDAEKGWNQDNETPPSAVAATNGENADAMKDVVSKDQRPDFNLNLKPDAADESNPLRLRDDKPAEPAKPEPPTEPWARMGYELEQNKTRVPPEDPLVSKMKSVGWTPSAAADEPDWKKLQSDLQAANDRANMTRTIQQSFHAVAPRFQEDPNAGAADIAAAKAPLEIAQARQNYAKTQETIDTEKEKGAAEKADLDPTSPVSERARNAYKAFFKDSPTPEGFEQFSAADVKRFAEDPQATLAKLKTEQDLNAFRLAEADKFRRSADTADTNAKTKADTATKAAADEATSMAIERQVLAGNPDLKRIPNPATGKPFTTEDLAGLDRKGLTAIVSEVEKLPKVKGGGGPSKAVHAPEDIADPADRAKVQAIVDGRADLSSVGRKDQGRIAGLVMQIDPNYDQTKFGAYKGERDRLTHDPEVVAANTALDHIERTKANIPDNFDSPTLNRIRNAVLFNTGSDKLSAFETDVRVMSDEIAKAYGANTEGGRQAQESLFSGVRSKADLIKRLNEQEGLLKTRLHSKEQQFEASAPKGTTMHLTPPPPAAAPSTDVKAWKNKKTGQTTYGTEAQLKGSKSPDDWEAVGG